ncbi:MAG: hypothetical protein WCQ99_08160 [Pseudomonadota bacterium]
MPVNNETAIKSRLSHYGVTEVDQDKIVNAIERLPFNEVAKKAFTDGLDKLKDEKERLTILSRKLHDLCDEIGSLEIAQQSEIDNLQQAIYQNYRKTIANADKLIKTRYDNYDNGLIIGVRPPNVTGATNKIEKKNAAVENIIVDIYDILDPNNTGNGKYRTAKKIAGLFDIAEVYTDKTITDRNKRISKAADNLRKIILKHRP